MARFTVLDDVYYDALLRVCDGFLVRELPFCLVGGGASQVWIASLVSGSGARRIGAEGGLPALLRKTRDLDFATRCDPREAMVLLNELAAESALPAHVLSSRTMRLGPVQISLTIEPEDLSGMADRYDLFLDSRESVRLRHRQSADVIPVIGLPALLATKLSRRGDKAKDLVDVGNLLAAARSAARTVDESEVRRYVGDDPEALQVWADIIGEEE